VLAAEQLWRQATRPAPALPVGVDETHLAPVYFDPSTDQHLMIFGDAECGKTALLRLFAHAIMARLTPEQARIVVVDHRRTLLGVVPDEYRVEYAASADVTSGMATGMHKLLTSRLPGKEVTTEQLRNRSWWSGPEIWFLVDDYDLVAGSGAGANNPLATLAELLPQARDVGLHLVIARRSGGAGRALYDPLLGKLRELDCPGLVMSGNGQEGALVGTVKPSLQPPGRGVLVRRSDGVNLVQTGFVAEQA
jgi:S-DNA-T family DNA segregation ATPase FtsK/SpoIIIE